MSDVYEARTLEDCERDGYPDLRRDELKGIDRKRRDERIMRQYGMWGGCVVV